MITKLINQQVRVSIQDVDNEINNYLSPLSDSEIENNLYLVLLMKLNNAIIANSLGSELNKILH
jgi:hypothetical protein